MSELFKNTFFKSAQTIISNNEKKADKILSDATFVELRDIIYKLSGIYYAEAKKYLLEGRIAKRLLARRLNTFEEYVEFLESSSGRLELNDLFEAITINETYFFRAEQQFEVFENFVVPEILKLKSNMPNPIFRVWSAASSTGEEAYTLAIIINERLKKRFPNVNFQILASDINNAVIESARRGVYRDYAVRNIPKDIMDKYFKKEAGSFVLSEDIRKMVRFMNINLNDEVAMRSLMGFDVIFCANVLIYFDAQSKQKTVSYLFDSLNKNGYLFIGYSESLHGVSKAFKLIHLPQAMVYKKD